MTDRIAVDKKKLFLVLLYSASCVAMSHYTFDVAEVDQSIDEAEHVPAFLSIVREQLGIARFVAERVCFSEGDSYMNSRYSTNEFSRAARTEFFLKQYLVDHGRGHEFIELLRKRALINSDRASYAHNVLAHIDETSFLKHYWARCPCIDERAHWLSQLTVLRKNVCEIIDSQLSLKQTACLLGSVYLLVQFVSDLGSSMLIDSRDLDDKSVLKKSLHGTNQQLYKVVRLLCCVGRNGTGLKPPTQFFDRQYSELYYWYLRTIFHGERNAKRRLVNDLGIYTSMSLMPDHGRPGPIYWDE